MLLWRKIIGLDSAMSYLAWQELGYNLKRLDELRIRQAMCKKRAVSRDMIAISVLKAYDSTTAR